MGCCSEEMYAHLSAFSKVYASAAIGKWLDLFICLVDDFMEITSKLPILRIFFPFFSVFVVGIAVDVFIIHLRERIKI